MTASKFPVLELFGPTIQGEGMVIGQKTMFVRTAGCDYSCAWCDSAFTWDGSAKEHIRLMTAEEIYAELKQIGGDTFQHVTISGGNPALLKGMGELVDLLHRLGMEVGLETQGSRWQDWFVDIDQLTLSPKPPSSQMTPDLSILDAIVARLEEANPNRTRFSLKVVVFDEQDLAFAVDLHKRYPDVLFYAQVGNDTTDAEEGMDFLQHLISRYEWLVDQVSASTALRNVRVLPQLHTYLWGNRRGV